MVSSTSTLRKRSRETTLSPQEAAAKKPEDKRPRVSMKEEKWIGVRAKKNLRESKPKSQAMKEMRARCAPPEAVLIILDEGVIYVLIFDNASTTIFIFNIFSCCIFENNHLLKPKKSEF